MYMADPLPVLMTSDAISYPISDQSDCDCDCSIAVGFKSPSKLIALDELSDQEILQVNDSVYRAPLVSGYELFFNPFSDAGVLVLAQSACQLLDWFYQPRSVHEVLNQSKDTIYVRDYKLIEQFVALGLLSRPGIASPLCFSTPQTLTVWLHITNQCNLRCSYCYINKADDVMSIDVGKKAIDAIFAAAKRYNFVDIKIKYSGGEATMNLPLVFNLQTYAQEKSEESGINIQSMILSNGISISELVARKLKRANIRLMISLDGVGVYHDAQRAFSNGRGSFFLVDRTIQVLLKVGLIPDISVTISESNLAGLSKLIDYMLAYDLPFKLNLVREGLFSFSSKSLLPGQESTISAMKSIFRQIEQSLPARSLMNTLADKANFTALHQFACGVGKNYMVITPSGEVAKCQMDIGNPVTTLFTEDPFWDLINDKKGIQNIPVDDKEACRDCAWRYWCAGGCPIVTYKSKGRYDAKSPNCDIYKALFPELLRLEGLRIIKYSIKK